MSTPKRTAPRVESTAQLAAALGLSRWSVSRALNGHSGVSPATIARVRAAMSRYGFTPSPLAQGLRRGRTDYIGVCLPELESLYLGPKLELLRRDLSQSGFQLIVGMTNGSADGEAKMLGQFGALRPAAIVSIASRQPPRASRRRAPEGPPLLLIDPLHEDARDAVSVDRSTGMREAAHHLLDLGHRTLTLVGFAEDSFYARMRLHGVQAACVERGLRPATVIRVLPFAETDESPLQHGFRLAAELCRLKPRPTALLALNDRMALGLIEGLRQQGVVVPRDVSVIGYDNMELGAFSTPRLTSVDARPDELMQRATTELLRRINGLPEPRPALPPVLTQLVVRGSTGPSLSPKK